MSDLAYISPCHPCEFNYYRVDDETGDCIEDICKCPEAEKNEKCWLEKWANEQKGKE